MNQKSSARPPDHGILKKELFGYAGICLVLLLLLGTGERLFVTFPMQGVLSALKLSGRGRPWHVSRDFPVPA